MAWDDPIVWLLIAAVVIFLFGASKIPQFARSIGQARREFTEASKGNYGSTTSNSSSPSPVTTVLDQSDPLVLAAQKEGINTAGKTREQIASEISWKLSKK
jgi:sec-independent protein translocase protein TatA